MPAEITYWTGHAPSNNNVAGRVISNESVTVGSASGATPANAVLVSIHGTEACRIEYSSAASSAGATSAYLGAGERLWLEARPTFIIDTASA